MFDNHYTPKKGSHSVYAKKHRAFVDKIEPNRQFHQHFLRAFFVRKFVQSQTLSCQNDEKLVRRMLMKLNPRGKNVE